MAAVRGIRTQGVARDSGVAAVRYILIHSPGRSRVAAFSNQLFSLASDLRDVSLIIMVHDLYVSHNKFTA